MAERQLKRKIYDELHKWKNEYAPECALFIKGARRVDTKGILRMGICVGNALLRTGIMPLHEWDLRSPTGNLTFFRFKTSHSSDRKPNISPIQN